MGVGRGLGVFQIGLDDGGGEIIIPDYCYCHLPFLPIFSFLCSQVVNCHRDLFSVRLIMRMGVLMRMVLLFLVK